MMCSTPVSYTHLDVYKRQGEDRCVIPSPKVATYDLKPEMSAYEVADECKARIESGKYDVIILNFANCDMVGQDVYKRQPEWSPQMRQCTE